VRAGPLAPFLLALALGAGPVAAETSAPRLSLFPHPRGLIPPPAAAAPAAAGPAEAAPQRSLVPHPKPALRPAQANLPGRVVLVAAGTAPARSPAPLPRPAGLAVGVALPVGPGPDTTAPVLAGAVCGDNAIRGSRIAAIRSATRGCGIENPVRLTEVAGVRLSQPATVDCTTAKALRRWVANAALPTIGRLGGGLRQLEVFDSYSCRPRNNQRGARLSEHGKGHAIDIGGFTLANGATITVLRGWGTAAAGRMLKRLHDSACGPFGTVLGPGSDGYHENHFHFDTARYRGGVYCK
jgi:hypothetical protein